MWNTGLDETEAGIKTARRTIDNLRYADTTTLTAESKEELKSLLMKEKDEGDEGERGKCKYWLKNQHSEY